jgi:hypothetical protein
VVQSRAVGLALTLHRGITQETIQGACFVTWNERFVSQESIHMRTIIRLIIADKSWTGPPTPRRRDSAP